MNRKLKAMKVTELGVAILKVLAGADPNNRMTLAEISDQLATKGWDCSEQQISNELETLTEQDLLSRMQMDFH